MSKLLKSTFFLACILIASVALAQTPAQPTTPHQPTFMQQLIGMLPMIAICYLVFYFMVIKPQATKLKAHQDLLTGLKRGDTVVTSGGIVGKVAGNEKDYILVEISQDVKIKVEPQHITKKAEEPVKSSKAA